MPPPMPKEGILDQIQWTLYRIRDNLISPCIKFRSVTHVANGTEGDIWVMCDGDRRYINKMSGNFQTIFGHGVVDIGSDVYYKANSVGFTRVKSGQILPFELHHNGIIYVTVRDSQYRTICDCFPIYHDDSVVVGIGGYVYTALYDHYWTDSVAWINHNPAVLTQPSFDNDPKDKDEREMWKKAMEEEREMRKKALEPPVQA